MFDIMIKIKSDKDKKRIFLNEMIGKFYLGDELPEFFLNLLKPILFRNTVAFACQLFSLSEFRYEFYSKKSIFAKIVDYTDLDELAFSFKENIFPHWVKNPEQKEEFTKFMIKRLLVYRWSKEEYQILKGIQTSIIAFQTFLKEYSSISKKQRRLNEFLFTSNFYKRKENTPVIYISKTGYWYNSEVISSLNLDLF